MMILGVGSCVAAEPGVMLGDPALCRARLLSPCGQEECCRLCSGVLHDSTPRLAAGELIPTVFHLHKMMSLINARRANKSPAHSSDALSTIKRGVNIDEGLGVGVVLSIIIQIDLPL